MRGLSSVLQMPLPGHVNRAVPGSTGCIFCGILRFEFSDSFRSIHNDDIVRRWNMLARSFRSMFNKGCGHNQWGLKDQMYGAEIKRASVALYPVFIQGSATPCSFLPGTSFPHTGDTVLHTGPSYTYERWLCHGFSPAPSPGASGS
jgi:hypothetical protein